MFNDTCTGAPMVALIVEDEPAIRGLLVAMLTDLNCVVIAAERGSDICAKLGAFCPGIIFLDVSLREGSAADILAMLADVRFAGAVQIVSGQDAALIGQVHSLGLQSGLTMLDPIAKPFRVDDIERPLVRIQSSEPACQARTLQQRRWRRPFGMGAGLVDLRLSGAGPACARIDWWLDQRCALAPTLDRLPAHHSFCVDAALQDVASLGEHLFRRRPNTRPLDTTIVIEEEQLCKDLAEGLDILERARSNGFTIRLTGAGTRFFSLAGHQGLPVHQAEIGQFLCTGDRDRKLQMLGHLAEVAHRAGIILLAADASEESDADAFTQHGVDLWQSSADRWSVVSNEARPATLRSARKPTLPGMWRKVDLSRAIAMRRAYGLAADVSSRFHNPLDV